MAVALQPVASFASRTLLKTGRPRCVDPPFSAARRNGVRCSSLSVQWQTLGAALTGSDATDHLGAVGDGLLGVEGAILARNSLANDLGVLIHEDSGL